MIDTRTDQTDAKVALITAVGMMREQIAVATIDGMMTEGGMTRDMSADVISIETIDDTMTDIAIERATVAKEVASITKTDAIITGIEIVVKYLLYSKFDMHN